jgi:hypothetical protein
VEQVRNPRVREIWRQCVAACLENWKAECVFVRCFRAWLACQNGESKTHRNRRRALVRCCFAFWILHFLEHCKSFESLSVLTSLVACAGACMSSSMMSLRTSSEKTTKNLEKKCCSKKCSGRCSSDACRTSDRRTSRIWRNKAIGNARHSSDLAPLVALLLPRDENNGEKLEKLVQPSMPLDKFFSHDPRLDRF